MGEASPLAGYSPDDIEATEVLLRGLDLDVLNRCFAAVGGRGTSLALLGLDRALDPHHHPAARFAIECALLDLASRHRGSPIVEMLVPSAGIRRGSLRVAGLLQGADPSAPGRARRLVDFGHDTLKLKIGRDIPRELELLHELRRDSNVKLRVDANRSLSLETAGALLPELARLGVEFIEEPCPRATRALAGLGVELALDESLVGIVAERLSSLLEHSGAKIVVLKPMLLGGFARCLALAAEAEAHGARIVVTHMFDGPVALRATTLLAWVIQSRSLACGLAPHDALAGWPAAPSAVNGPEIEAPSVSKIGLLDEPWP